MNQNTDSILFARLKAGDKNALSELYIKYFDYLMHYGIRIVHDKCLVEECIQELFLYLFEVGDGLGNVKNAKAYLFSSLRRRTLAKAEKERKIKRSEHKLIRKSNVIFTIDEILIFNETQRDHIPELLNTLNTLPWRQKEAIYLRYYNNLSTKEIAEVMGVANQTILNTLYQALKKIRASFAEKGIPNS